MQEYHTKHNIWAQLEWSIMCANATNRRYKWCIIRQKLTFLATYLSRLPHRCCRGGLKIHYLTLFWSFAEAGECRFPALSVRIVVCPGQYSGSLGNRGGAVLSADGGNYLPDRGFWQSISKSQAASKTNFLHYLSVFY